MLSTTDLEANASMGVSGSGCLDDQAIIAAAAAPDLSITARFR